MYDGPVVIVIINPQANKHAHAVFAKTLLSRILQDISKTAQRCWLLLEAHHFNIFFHHFIMASTTT